ncbi:MAG: glycosyltransferase family 39 protein [Chloroflexi bacterium]|nr:glycosyltransferase family 39 protein [Chloroflexota bacterium]
MNHRRELVLVTCFLLLAAVFRLWDLTRLPPGFSEAELAYIRITETMRQGDVAVYYQVEEHKVRAGMYGVGSALVTELVGDGLLGFRLFPLWTSLITLALLYRLARHLFGVPVALIALGAMSLNLRAIILARSATSESLVPAYVLLALLCLINAFNVREEMRFRTPTTLSFALMALLFGGSGYLHYTGLLLGPIAAIFFGHLLITHQPLSRRMWSAWTFAIALATIVAIPYLISTFRDIALSEPYTLWIERPRSLTDVVNGILSAIGGVIWQGDARASYNLPESAVFGPATTILLLIGTGRVIRCWREPRYALVLLVLLAGLITDAWVEPESTFSAHLVALPAVYLLPGIGAVELWRILRGRGVAQAWQPVTVILVLILIANLVATRDHLFNDWKHDPQTQTAYHARLGALAAYLDRTPDGLPVSMCAARLVEPDSAGLSPFQILPLMMHREGLQIRHSDCRGGLVLINAGAPMRFAFAQLNDRDEMPPELAEWLSDAVPIPVEGLPEGSVLRLDVEQRVRDSGGYWSTFSPAFFMPDQNGSEEQVPLPVALENNLTFAGYDPRALSAARTAGADPIVLVSYWRVDGRLPDDLGIFAHLLAYPDNESRVPLLEPWAEANSLDVIPNELQNRDFFAQVSYIWLSDSLAPGQYALTVGAYTNEVAILDNHLEILDVANDSQPHGERLLLGDVTVNPPPEPPK